MTKMTKNKIYFYGSIPDGKKIIDYLVKVGGINFYNITTADDSNKIYYIDYNNQIVSAASYTMTYDLITTNPNWNCINATLADKQPGEFIDFNGTLVEVIEAEDISSCDGCVFHHNEECVAKQKSFIRSIIGDCIPNFRFDKKSIIFKKHE